MLHIKPRPHSNLSCLHAASARVQREVFSPSPLVALFSFGYGDGDCACSGTVWLHSRFDAHLHLPKMLNAMYLSLPWFNLLWLRRSHCGRSICPPDTRLDIWHTPSTIINTWHLFCYADIIYLCCVVLCCVVLCCVARCCMW